MKSLKVFAIYLLIFNQMLDTSIANLALATISSELHMDVYHASWVMTAFGTGLIISFSLGNFLKEYISVDYILAMGSLIFIFSSYLCGKATTSDEFLIYRFIQGLSSGVAVLVSQAIMLQIMGEQKKALAIALWTSAISLAPVCGPLFGAVITDYLSWHWLFLINVPLTSLSLIILLPDMKFERYSDPNRSKGKLVTLSFFSLAIMSLQYTLDFGELYQWFKHTYIRLSFICALLFGFAFFVTNRKYTLFDFNVLKIQSYRSATIISSIGNGLIFSSIVFFPVWLQRDYGMPLLESGLIIASASAVAAVLTPVIGRYLAAKFFAIASASSLLFTAISFYMMSQNSVDSSQDYLIVSRLVAGLGLAIFTMPLTALSLKDIKNEQIINANSIAVMLRILLANLMVTISFIIINHQSRVNYNNFSASVDRHSILNLLEQSHNYILSYQLTLARTDAMNQIFFISALIFLAFSLVMLPIAWRNLVKEK